MKYILSILLLIPEIVFCQTAGHYMKVSPAEYTCQIMDTVTKKAWFVNGDTSTVQNTPACVQDIASGAHGSYLTDCSGFPWYQGENLSGQGGQGNTSTLTGYNKISIDSAGNPFNNVIQVSSAGTTGSTPYFALFLKGDGTLWVCGNTLNGTKGDHTAGSAATTRPVIIPFPAGTFIVKMQAGIVCQALDSAGNEWRWGANTGFYAPYLLAQGTNSPILNTPVKVTFPGTSARVVDIADGNVWCMSLMADGKLYVSTYLGIYAMVGSGPYTSGPTASTLPFRADTAISLSSPIKNIYCNSMGNFFLCTNGSIWFAGDNSCGNAGDGNELNYSIYTTNPAPYGGTNSFQYAWDQDPATCQLPYRKPIQIAPGKNNFVSIFVTNSICFCAWAIDSYGQLYSWGRAKSGVLGSALLFGGSGIDATYPNNMDETNITKRNPFVPTNTFAGCQLDITAIGSAPCNTYSNTNTTRPTANVSATVTGNKVVLNSSSSVPGGSAKIILTKHTQVAGTAISNPIKANVTDTLYNVPVGSYTFQTRVTNNGWLSDSTTVNFTVLPSNSISIPVGAKIIAH